MIAERLARVRLRVAVAAQEAGRDPRDVRLLLATKTQPADLVREALAADARARADDPAATALLVGENRVQELVAKGPELAGFADVHLIGPLQSNKVNAALRWASCIESLASLDLAQRLSARTTGPLDVYVQVNVSGEPTKHGVAPEQAVELATAVAALPRLRVAGLMTVGARSADPAVVRSGYALLRGLRDELVASGTRTATELSMGMSGDLELAVAEGATLVRVGSAVFGPRPT
ncbi:YggS family pyridoxal phosphate-dependent enzyme [Cellulomonas fengjieae]|uniref:Pyridoxal phosphate homeostasis protein n=1 Tax=Cellulomonas fengjieae TaxID=2819978 RepID=A0ABS3SGF9_9CELL|nr:YggS family pyridoxal phosphate-dependent enzyme [Cellulomonas fengjieae]MBO3084817.1 YggS family pyridoxal phosphate-dependent enzyme [Cellulomonas fengjieae]QVI66867.1 YggS family pyridoxal phosphate-dependent enzyme [Cellulomonas fengjieae]